MPVYDDENSGEHDDLGISAEDRKAEIADLENQHSAPSTSAASGSILRQERNAATGGANPRIQRGGFGVPTPPKPSNVERGGFGGSMRDKNAGISPGDSFSFNNKGDEQQTRGQKAKSFLKKRKFLLIGGGSLLSMIALVLLIIFILGSLPISTSAVLLERQLDRALRNSANSSEQVI